jgi:hypothetical protein
MLLAVAAVSITIPEEIIAGYSVVLIDRDRVRLKGAD